MLDPIAMTLGLLQNNPQVSSIPEEVGGGCKPDILQPPAQMLFGSIYHDDIFGCVVPCLVLWTRPSGKEVVTDRRPRVGKASA